MVVIVEKLIKRFVSKKGSALNCVDVVQLEDVNYLGSLGFDIDYLIPDYCIHQNKELNKYYIEFEDSEVSTGNNLAAFFTMVCFVVLIFINCKSTKKEYVDYFRLISIYVGGTLVFAFWQSFGPDYGFNRFIGFSILTHNLGEFIILYHLWFGNRYNPRDTIRFIIALIVYVMTMFLSIAYLNLNGLFIFGSIQGASMDFMLILTFSCVPCEFKFTFLDCLKCKCYSKLSNTRYRAFITGAFGAILHVISILPIFGGMWLGNSTIQFSLTLFVSPAFMIYTIFAAKQLGYCKLLAQNNIELTPNNNEMNNDENNLGIELHTQKKDELEEDNKQQNNQQLQIKTVNSVSIKKSDDKPRTTIEQHGILKEFFGYNSFGDNICCKIGCFPFIFECCHFRKFIVFWKLIIFSIILSSVGNFGLLISPCFGHQFGFDCVRRF